MRPACGREASSPGRKTKRAASRMPKAWATWRLVTITSGATSQPVPTQS